MEWELTLRSRCFHRTHPADRISFDVVGSPHYDLHRVSSLPPPPKKCVWQPSFLALPAKPSFQQCNFTSPAFLFGSERQTMAVGKRATEFSETALLQEQFRGTVAFNSSQCAELEKEDLADPRGWCLHSSILYR